MTTTHRTTSIAAAAALALAGLTGAASTATAGGPTPVDPASVTPRLNPAFAPWDCWRTGTGITCQGESAPTYANEPLGLFCDGLEVYVSGGGHDRMTRWHTADGLATRTVVTISTPGDVFSLSPTGEGPTVTISSHFVRHYTYLVPGDISQRVLTHTGASDLGRAEPGEPRLKGAGLLRFAPGEDFETVTAAHGTIASLDGEQIETWICDGLT
ncbi:hypothetical protein ACK8HX_04825 [Oryzobacter sp. R7]|uniref:hypothetical protein n=1 Tax=Oryzobacter faecalis TaxID=3388656 RepID=UPI00398C9299